MIRYKKDTDNIVTLTLDMKDRPVNVINHEIAQSFLPVIEHLLAEKNKGALRGIIIASAKKTFLAGGDLEYLYQTFEPKDIFNFSQTIQNFFRKLESPGVPVVAAINGTALGLGFELALACHHRILIDDLRARIGHPEITLGLMPAGGGVTRLLWILGLKKTFEILASGRKYRPREAYKLGLVNALAEDETDMLEQARNWIMQNPEGIRPWDTAEGKIPGGTVRDKKVAHKARLLSAELSKVTYNNYPAQQAILNTLIEASKVDFDTACRIESRNFTELLMGKVSRNMIKAFWFDNNAIKSGANRPKGIGKFRPKKVGIIGAGRMGSGIAFVSLKYDMEVIIKDVSKSVAERSREYIGHQFDQLIKTARITPEEKAECMSRLTTTDSAAEFESCDLVIEAVFENKMVKQNVLREAEELMDEYSFFGTNTVSIPVTELAESAMRPANFVGLHFFSPVEQTRLVEIVRGKKTSDETVAKAFDFVRKIYKTPIIVKDSWGFYASRVQNTYVLEGIQMLQEGYPPALIENLGKQVGMPSGALALADDMSLELALTYEEQAAKFYGAKYIQHPAATLLKIMIEDLKRPGRKKRAGFYEYDNDGSQHLWPALAEHFPVTQKNFDLEEIKERFLFVQVLEGIWCLQEGIVSSIPEANLGSTFGWGFPAFKGGVIQYVNDYGVEEFIAKCKEYEAEHGPRFSIPKMLKQMASKGAVFA